MLISANDTQTDTFFSFLKPCFFYQIRFNKYIPLFALLPI